MTTLPFPIEYDPSDYAETQKILCDEGGYPTNVGGLTIGLLRRGVENPAEIAAAIATDTRFPEDRRNAGDLMVGLAVGRLLTKKAQHG
jgi:hypothetical protein